MAAVSANGVPRGERASASSMRAGRREFGISGGEVELQATSAAPEAIDALAFATDAASESALREGLSHLANAQAWGGGLRAGVEALRQGEAAPLVFVDLDGEAYPAGALYELAVVCEEGTAVVAFGTDASASYCRAVLFAGVSDYLVKPLSAADVRTAAERAVGGADDGPRGVLVGFTGTGGTGATTLAALTALGAASRGRFVSVLDLNRTSPAATLALDVEPASGLVDLLGTAARASLNPEMVERVGVSRSPRLTVYGYAQGAGATPPPAPAWAVCELLVELQRRSHLVIVEGVDDLHLAHAVLALVDTRVLVIEPTATGASAAARTIARLGPLLGRGWPHVVVQNHTRAFDLAAGERALARAGFRAKPHVAVPFEPALPNFSAWGMPDKRVPRTLREPLAGLVDRVLAAGVPETEAAALAQTPAQAPAAGTRRAQRSRAPASRGRRTSLLGTLRGLLPSNTGRALPARGT